MKFCKDCKYYKVGTYSSECKNEKALFDIDKVTGKKYFHNPEGMRGVGGVCGDDAKLFEPKETKIAFFKKFFGKS